MSGIYTLIYTLKYMNATYVMTFRNFFSIKFCTQKQAWRHRRNSKLVKGACALDLQIFTEEFKKKGKHRLCLLLYRTF